MNLPNSITVARIMAAPFIAGLALAPSWPPRLAAFVLFIVAAVTDYYDGMLARTRGLVTDLGKLLDPLADRIFIVALAVALVAEDALPLWLALSVVARDVILVAAFPFVDRSITRIPVSFAGKTATAALLLGLTLIAYAETTFPEVDGIEEAGLGAVIFGAVLYWITGVEYAIEALRRMLAARGEPQR